MTRTMVMVLNATFNNMTRTR